MPPCSLPAEVAQQLRFLDANQDGTIDFDELLKFSDAGRRAVLKHRKYRRLFIGLAVAVLLQILAFFGVMIGVVELTRQSVVTNQVMVVKGTNTPIQLASSDFYVDGDGVLRMRVANATNATAAGRRLLSTGTPPVRQGATRCLTPADSLAAAGYHQLAVLHLGQWPVQTATVRRLGLGGRFGAEAAADRGPGERLCAALHGPRHGTPHPIYAGGIAAALRLVVAGLQAADRVLLSGPSPEPRGHDGDHSAAHLRPGGRVSAAALRH